MASISPRRNRQIVVRSLIVLWNILRIGSHYRTQSYLRVFPTVFLRRPERKRQRKVMQKSCSFVINFGNSRAAFLEVLTSKTITIRSPKVRRSPSSPHTRRTKPYGNIASLSAPPPPPIPLDTAFLKTSTFLDAELQQLS